MFLAYVQSTPESVDALITAIAGERQAALLGVGPVGVAASGASTLVRFSHPLTSPAAASCRLGRALCRLLPVSIDRVSQNRDAQIYTAAEKQTGRFETGSMAEPVSCTQRPLYLFRPRYLSFTFSWSTRPLLYTFVCTLLSPPRPASHQIGAI